MAMRGEREEQSPAAKGCSGRLLLCVLPVVELRNRSINSWLILVLSGAVLVCMLSCGIPQSGQ